MEGKQKKTPVHPRTGKVSGASPAIGVSFDEVLQREKQYKVSGIGFVLTKEANITCIDFDDVLDETGDIMPQHEEIARFIEDLGEGNCYIEKSQSERGLHCFLQGVPPEDRTRTTKHHFPVEIYCHSRYIAVTGNTWCGHNRMDKDPEHQQQMLNKLYFEVFPDAAKSSTTEVTSSVPTGRVDKIIELLKHAANATKFNNLFNGGGMSDDRSADDMTLANMIAFYTQDPAEIETIMRKSSLVREKWDRKSYLLSTINRAISGQSNTYDWAESERREAEYQAHKSSGNSVIMTDEIRELEKSLVKPGTKAQADLEQPKKSKKSNAGKIIAAESHITERYLLYKNVVNGFVYFSRKDDGNYIQMTDHERSNLFLELQKNNIEISEQLYDHILKSDSIPQKNPLTEFFSELPEWDGFDHIGAYLAHSIIPLDKTLKLREQNALFIKKWLVGVVACAMSKSVVNDLCLIFKGAQGIGKSTWFKHLLPDAMTDYSVSFKVSDKSADTGMIVCSSLICNMDELEDISKRDDGEIKRLISQKVFTLRKPYDRLPNNYCRYSSFCGSTNDSTFLKDQTGNRRYIVLDVERLNFEVIKTYDKVKLWAQILHEYKTGFKYWLTQEENAIVSARNSSYSEKTPEEELLLAKFKPAEKDNWTHRMNATQLLQFLDIKKIDARAIKSMGMALAKNGFIQGKAKVRNLMGDSSPLRVWYLIELSKDVTDYEYE